MTVNLAFHADDAACRTNGTADAIRDMQRVMFAVWNERGIQAARRHTEALTYCNRCPVRAECLEWALDHPTLIGDHLYRPALSSKGRPTNQVGDIWGGKTVDERWRLRIARGGRVRAMNRGNVPHGTHQGVKRHRDAGTPLCDECAAVAGAVDHGTLAGWFRHGLDGTPLCDACAAISNAEHGTDAGWTWHRINGSRPCGDCALAHIRATPEPEWQPGRPPARAQLAAATAALQP